VLSTWHHLIDLGSLLDGDEELAGTARRPVVRLSKARAAELGVSEGDAVTVGTERGALTLPLEVTDMPDAVVWLPTNSPGSTVRRTLAVPAGSLVTIAAAPESPAAPEAVAAPELSTAAPEVAAVPEPPAGGAR
jgi:NADH-quinone oxidoreductase subunit G